MKRNIKKLLPRPIAKLITKITDFFAIIYYSMKYSPLIIRDNTDDIRIFHSIFVKKDYNIPIKIKPKFIIDAGAYVGYSSMYFSSKYPNAKIISIEPEKNNFSTLKENTKNINNIEVINAGLWYKNCLLNIIDRGTGNFGFMLKEISSPPNNASIKSITIKNIMERFGIDEIDILKIDIEGAEKELFLKDSKNWIDKVNIIIIELHDKINDGCSDVFYSSVSGIKWDKYKRGENIILIRKS